MGVIFVPIVLIGLVIVALVIARAGSSGARSGRRLTGSSYDPAPLTPLDIYNPSDTTPSFDSGSSHPDHHQHHDAGHHSGHDGGSPGGSPTDTYDASSASADTGSSFDAGGSSDSGGSSSSD